MCYCVNLSECFPWQSFRNDNYAVRKILLVRRSFSEAGHISFLLTCFLFISHFSFSQATIYNWDKTIGGNADDNLYGIQPTTDGGTILIGSSYSALSADKSEPSQGSSDYWLVKLDANGNKTWDKTLGGLGDDIGTCIRQLPGGDYIAGGYSYSDSSGDKSQPTRGDDDFWLIKTDSAGNKIWDKRFGGISAEQLFDIVLCSDGGFLLAGHSNSQISGDKTEDAWGTSWDYWVVRTDSNGNKLWDKTIGGLQSDYSYSALQSFDGGFIIAGTSDSYASGNKTAPLFGSFSFTDYWVVKLDANGNVLWDKDFGGSHDDDCRSIVQIQPGYFLLGGISNSGVSGNKSATPWGNADFWAVKIDSAGSKIWDHVYGGFNDEDDFGNIVITPDGGAILAGTSYSAVNGTKTTDNLGGEQPWFQKIDSTGSPMWDITLQTTGNEELGIAAQTTDTCYVFATCSKAVPGGFKSDYGKGALDYFAAKFCATIYPVSLFNAPLKTGCPSSCFDFMNNSVNATSYQWLFPGANPSSSTVQDPVNICYANPGSYDVTLISFSPLGSDTLTLFNFITIFTPVAVTISQSGNSLTCNPAATSYQWFFNGNLIPNSNSQTISVAQNGTYTVDAVDSNGCISVASIVVTNLSPLNFNASSTFLCEKFCINFYDLSSNNPTAWQWLFPGGIPSSSTSQNPVSICYNITGSYDVTLITTSASGNDTLTFPNYVTVYPTPPFPLITQTGLTLTSSSAANYQWQFNSVDIPGATSQSYHVNQTGYYTVFITDQNGCSSSATIYVLITGIEEVDSDANVLVYPNPSNGSFIVECPNSSIGDEVSIIVYNTLGQIVFSSDETISIATWKKQIALKDVIPGIYFIEIKMENDFVKRKIMVEK
jgi:PKD repeat protein